MSGHPLPATGICVEPMHLNPRIRFIPCISQPTVMTAFPAYCGCGIPCISPLGSQPIAAAGTGPQLIDSLIDLPARTSTLKHK